MGQNENFGVTDTSQTFVNGHELTGDEFIESLTKGDPLGDDGALYSSVQNAVNASSSWVFVPPGTFNERVFIDTAGLTLAGVGYDTHIDSPTGQSSGAVTIDAPNVTVQDLSVTGGVPGNGNIDHGITTFSNANRAVVKNITVRDTDSRGIYNDDGEEHVVINCRVEGADEQGIDVNTNSTVVGNILTGGVSDDAINPGDGSLIAYNILYNIGTGSGDYGILGANDCIFIGNRIINVGDDGIYMGSGKTDNLIANNRVSDSGGTDIDDNGTSTLLDQNLTGSSN